MVDSRFSWGVTRVTPRLFEKQIQLLRAAGTEFFTVSEYLQLDQSASKKAIAITYDDGYESIFKNAFPILEMHNIKATVFVNPNYVGNYNTWDANFGKRIKHMDWHQIRQLKEAGWEVGSHGLMHQDLTKLPALRVEREFVQSRRRIHDYIGSCSNIFSFPFGNINGKVWQQCLKAGYTHALAMGSHSLAKKNEQIAVRTGIYLFDIRPLFLYKVFAKDRFFINLIEKFFDACSNLTVLTQSKKWNVDKN